MKYLILILLSLTVLFSQVELILVANGDTIDINYVSTEDIYGFQCDVGGTYITGINSTGLDFVQFSKQTIFALVIKNDPLPAGKGTILTFSHAKGGATVSLSDVVVAGYGGKEFDFTLPKPVVTNKPAWAGIRKPLDFLFGIIRRE